MTKATENIKYKIIHQWKISDIDRLKILTRREMEVISKRIQGHTIL